MSEGLTEKEKVGLRSTCSIPHLPCPVSTCDPNSGGSRPSPRTVKGSGSRGDLLVDRAAQWTLPTGGYPGPSRSPDADECFLVL